MVDRIKNILLTPKTEWDRIDAEPMTEKGIFTGWVLPLAAIPAVAGFVGGQVFGYGAFGIVFKPPIMSALVTAILTLVMAVIGVWIVAKIVDALAPNFGATKNSIAATKVVAFSYTASWVAGVLAIIPQLALLAMIGGLYSLYLLYLGLPKLMKAPQDKALGYTVVTVLCAIVLSLIISAVIGALSVATVGSMMRSPTALSGTVNVPGGGSVDLGKLNAAATAMQANVDAVSAAATGTAATAGGAGAITVTDPSALQALLPASVAGWTRTSIEGASGGAGGIGGSNAKADYSRGDDTASLSVTDMGAMGALAGLGAAFNVTSNKTTATGYEMTGQVDGRMTTEKWDSESRRGNYSTVVANRFMLEVDGHADNADALKALAASVPIATLTGMAK
jgi:hypothetical protein